jgi:hypothetical protein
MFGASWENLHGARRNVENEKRKNKGLWARFGGARTGQPSCNFQNGSPTLMADSNDIAEAPDCKAASAVGSYDVTVSLSSGVFHLTNTRAASTTFVGSYSNPSDLGEAIKFQAFIKSAFKCRSDRNGSVRH